MIGKDPTQSISTLKFARTRAIETVDNLRRMIGNLRPPALEELGLVTALKMLAKDVSDISVNIKTEGIERRLAEAQELTLSAALRKPFVMCKNIAMQSEL